MDFLSSFFQFIFAPPVLAAIIYITCLLFIIVERVDKAIVALSGALLLVLTGILDFHEAINYIDFETILLLMGMMMIMYISTKTGIFSWLNTKIASLTNGNPLVIFIIFLSITALFSAFFDNVTTIIIVVPITIAITQGLGLNPKIFVISEIMFSNIGGALTLIGDPPNILIGSAAKLSFNQFIINLWIPITCSITVILIILLLRNWKSVKPIKTDLVKLFMAHLLIKKICFQFYKTILQKKFILITIAILSLTIISFIFQSYIHQSVGIIAMCGAMLLLLFTSKHVDIHETFRKVEWPTLFFFIGLFILTGGLEKTGLLSSLSDIIVNLTDNFTYLILIVLWTSGLVSMLVDNIPFVAVMIPVIVNLQAAFPTHPHVSLLWWALSLGACFGGNGTLIGASANLVGVSLAKDKNIKIGFIEYTKTAFPLTIITLIIASIYLLYRLKFT